MTQVNNTTFKTDTNTLYPDNTSGQISPADIRAQMDNIADSVPFKLTGQITAPTANDDGSGTGGNGSFEIGDFWIDETNDIIYSCVDNTATAAIWLRTGLTDAQIKTAYESNANTNEFTDAEKTKLATVGTGADVVKVGTTIDNQLGVWTGDGTIEGDINLTWDGLTLSTLGDVSVTGDIIVTGTVDGRDIAADGTKLDTIATGANVIKVSVPANNQVGVWTGDGTIEGDAGLTWDGLTLVATAINSTPIGSVTPSTGSFTTLDATTLDSTPIGSIVPSTGDFTTLTSTGGSLNGSIGAITPAAGSFTTLDATTLDSTPIGSVTPSSGAFTTLTATTLDGTLIGSITPSTGDFTTLTSTGGALNGSIGSITPDSGSFTTLDATTLDGTPIGSVTPSSGSFTTLAATTLDSTPIGSITPSTGDFTNLVANDLVTDNSQSYRNLIINGNFDVWQRGTSQTATGYGSDDRWLNNSAGTTKTHSQQAFTVGQTDVPNNPEFYSRTAVTSVAGVGNYSYKSQKIKDVSRLSGETVTVSFWAKADAAKNIAIEFRQEFGTGGSSTVSGIGAQLIAITTGWALYTATVTLPSVAGKTIGAGNITRFVIWFDAGSDFDANSASLGQQSGTFDIAQVQLEEGSVATAFEHMSYDEHLHRCLPYYWRLDRYDDLQPICTGYNQTSIQSRGAVLFPRRMIQVPHTFEQSGTPGEFSVLAGGSDRVCTGVPTGTVPGRDSFQLAFATAAVLTLYEASILRFSTSSVGAYIAWSAEL